MLRHYMIVAFAIYLRQNPEQKKNNRETDEADTDEGQIAQSFPPYQIIRVVVTLKKRGNSLRTAPLRFLDSHKLNMIIS